VKSHLCNFVGGGLRQWPLPIGPLFPLRLVVWAFIEPEGERVMPIAWQAYWACSGIWPWGCQMSQTCARRLTGMYWYEGNQESLDHLNARRLQEHFLIERELLACRPPCQTATLHWRKLTTEAGLLEIDWARQKVTVVNVDETRGKRMKRDSAQQILLQ